MNLRLQPWLGADTAPGATQFYGKAPENDAFQKRVRSVQEGRWPAAQRQLLSPI